MKRLSTTETPAEDHQLMLVLKTLKGVKWWPKEDPPKKNLFPQLQINNMTTGDIENANGTNKGEDL